MSGVKTKNEDVNGTYVARAIIWIFLAAITTGVAAFAKEVVDKNAEQDTKIAVIQSQYIEINKNLTEIKNDVSYLRKRQESK